MSVDLSVCINLTPRIDETNIHVAGFVVDNYLKLEKDYQLWDAIKSLKSNNLPVPLEWDNHDDGYVEMEEDYYGEPIKFVKAEQFKLIDTKDLSEWNKAVFAFLTNIPGSTWVVLYWH
jgi:hypothetical protein